MVFLKSVLSAVMFLIYAVFAIVLLYFPFFELVSFVNRELRLFRLPRMMSVDDALLPCLLLATAYGVISFFRRKIEPDSAPKESERGAVKQESGGYSRSNP
jgi:hypothetical protein